MPEGAKEPTPRPGVTFERAVAAVQQLIDPTCTVTHNEYLPNRLGHRRQFDVVIRTQAAGHDILGVIECRDQKRRVDTPAVEAFSVKSRDVGANLTVIASRSGFTGRAIKAAEFYGVGTVSLLSPDEADSTFSIGSRGYATIWRWGKYGMGVHFQGEKPALEPFNFDEVTYHGRRVGSWFRHQLVTTYQEWQEEAWLKVPIVFKLPRRLRIRDRECLARGLSFHAERICEKRTKWIRWSGAGFYDWQKNRLLTPSSGSFASDSWKADHSDWEAYQGEIPPSIGVFDLRCRVYATPLFGEPEIDLTVL